MKCQHFKIIFCEEPIFREKQEKYHQCVSLSMSIDSNRNIRFLSSSRKVYTVLNNASPSGKHSYIILTPLNPTFI